jgi:hypothetical protein
MHNYPQRNSVTSALSRSEFGGAGGKALVWLALLVVLVAGGYWAWKNPDEVNRLTSEGKRLVGITAGTPPASSEQASPATPNASLATPETPNPVVATTERQMTPPPPPPPPAVDMAALVSTPARWPKTVTLNKKMKFPIVLDGRVAGSIALPAGTVVTLKAVKNGRLTVAHQNTLATVAPQDTDLAEKLTKGTNVGGR